jgi:DNA-binding XRE family transcriptional regulator
MPTFIHAIGKRPNQIYRLYGTWGERRLPNIRSRIDLYAFIAKELGLSNTISRKDIVFVLLDKSWDGSKWVDDMHSRIKALREKSGLTQIQLAEKSGLSLEGIRALEQGLRKPSYETLKRIAIALNIGVEKIIYIPKLDNDSESHEVIYS